jgi:hypothetical protein
MANPTPTKRIYVVGETRKFISHKTEELSSQIQPGEGMNTQDARGPSAERAPISNLEIPTAEEVFDRPYDPPAVPCPEAWTGDSIAVELADRECARLIANALHDPPITDEEIDRHARRFGLSFREAELEIRREREGF